MAKIHAIGGQRAKSGLVVLRKLYELPIINIRKVEEWTGLSRPAANGLVKALIEKGILEQRNRRTKYGRDFEYKKYLKLFTDETK